MPKSGFHSITVSDAVYTNLKKQYEQNRDDLRKLGINSMSGYVTAVCHAWMGQHTVYDLATSTQKEWARKILARKTVCASCGDLVPNIKGTMCGECVEIQTDDDDQLRGIQT